MTVSGGLGGTASLRSELVRVVGVEHVLTDPEIKRSYEQDITGRYAGEALLVVRPGDSEQVAQLMAIFRDTEIPVVPQGGNTGLVGGGVPLGGEVVMNLGRLSGVESLDLHAGQATVLAGTTLAELQEVLQPTQFEFAVDHGARTGATLGGMAATNAGGARVFRFGAMRAQVLGFEAIFPDGSIVTRLSGLIKDNVGYDLGALLVGSEGTLAVLSKVLVRLVPKSSRRLTGLVSVGDLQAAVELFEALRLHVPSLVACDFFTQDGMDLVCRHKGLEPPFKTSGDVFVVLECWSDDDPAVELARGLETAPELAGEAFADDSAGRARLWLYREAHNEAINASGVPQKFDVSLPHSEVPSFESEVRHILRSHFPAAEVINYGHLGDGNVHVNVLGLDAGGASADELVLKLAASYGGSISAEHGIGQSRQPFIGLSRSASDLAVMEAVKRALDPHWLLNPGKLLAANGQPPGISTL